jgi:hypothetical protein
MKKLSTSLLFVLAVMISTQLALGQVSTSPCDIGGTIVATPTNNPAGPAWAYTLTIDWDTGSQYALSHMNLLMDTAAGTCNCADFSDALSWNSPVGSSSGDPACLVSYNGFLGCHGDPSIPGVDNILLKFEPAADGCEPGTTGTGTFVFFSNLPPAPIDEDVLTLVDKYAANSCFGTLSGDFPAMVCDPVSAENVGWGSAKGLYR